MPPAIDQSAIAAAVQAEIERQQASVNYDEMEAVELQRVVEQLSSKLALCQEALAKKAKPEVAALKAEKATGTWPELPWGPAGKQDADKIKAYIEEQMLKRIMVIDGAMGTTIQQYKFSEADFRGAPHLSAACGVCLCLVCILLHLFLLLLLRWLAGCEVCVAPLVAKAPCRCASHRR